MIDLHILSDPVAVITRAHTQRLTHSLQYSPPPTQVGGVKNKKEETFHLKTHVVPPPGTMGKQNIFI